MQQTELNLDGPRARLPTGIQTFGEIRNEGLYYVDKTPFALQLMRQSKHFLLARPRRFGKSLFLSTLRALFEGKRELFDGLAAYGVRDWSIRRCVLLLDMSQVIATVPGNLDTDVCEQLLDLESDQGVERRHSSAAGRLRHLIRTLHDRSGRRVVVLVDEYDKPIVDALHQPELALAHRDYLRDLYSVVKSCDPSVRFTLFTGVTNFSKASLFSNLDNLRDITLNPAYSSICGYTDRDLDTVFAPELSGLDRDKIREWYYGYRWGGDERVYNPFAILLLFEDRKFRHWWHETGTPDFLVKTLFRRGVQTPELSGMHADEELLSSFDIGSISTEALLFQTGYLTLAESSEDEDSDCSYRLEYPNREVRVSLNRSLLGGLGSGLTGKHRKLGKLVAKHVRSADFKQMERVLHTFFASIPHDWHRRNKIASYEAYYTSVFYSLLNGFGLDARPEGASGAGRLDLAVHTRERVLLFEFKVQEQASPGAALAQLKARGYADRYSGTGRAVHLVGVEFSAETRNVALVEAETV